MEEFKYNVGDSSRFIMFPEPIQNDLIEFTPEAMEKLYEIFGAPEGELKNYHDDFHNKCMNLITKDNSYSDNIEPMGALEAVGNLFNKASFGIGVQGLNVPRNLLPNKYWVTKVEDGGIYIRIIVEKRFFPEQYREMWEKFKNVIPTIKFTRPEHQFYVQGHSF